MSSTLLELARQNHEILEKYEDLVGTVLDSKPNGKKQKTWQQHRVKICVNHMSDRAKDLLKTYQDSEFMLKDEIDCLRAGSDLLSGFYGAVNATKEYHAKYPSTVAPTQLSVQDLNVDIQFSGEEVFGKYLDLNDHFQTFCNVAIKFSIEQDYLQYLERFNNFFYLPEGIKIAKPYLDYLEQLFNYLTDFFRKVHPLVDLDSLRSEWETEFAQRCLNNEVPDYKVASSTHRADSAPQALRLGMFNDASELEALGMERLKDALEAVGVKCGGTLQARAERLWSIRGKKAEDYPPSILAKKRKLPNRDAPEVSGKNESSGSSKGLCDYSRDILRNRVARKENDIQCLCELMADTVTATRKHAEKQQTRTVEEKEAEIREEEFGLLPDVKTGEDGESGAVSEDEDEEPIYNPLNIPLGWDGKPIPYWLYKLHGLGNEFKCEICGNHSYWGRRAFDRHFQESKHAAGMRALGVPNTKHFHDITLIEDALALHAKFSGKIASDKFEGEIEEEFEDSEGNILNRRTYEDLARQGLL